MTKTGPSSLSYYASGVIAPFLTAITDLKKTENRTFHILAIAIWFLQGGLFCGHKDGLQFLGSSGLFVRLIQ